MLSFTPYVWAKLRHMRNKAETEIGGFGITAPDNRLLVTDFVTVKQKCTAASVKFDDTAVADFFDDQVDAGRHPSEFGRVWIHTHPGSSPSPSTVDEQTFKDAFGATDWSIMFIMADYECYARLRLTAPFQVEFELDYGVSYYQPFAASNAAAWDEELKRNVSEVYVAPVFKSLRGSYGDYIPGYGLPAVYRYATIRDDDGHCVTDLDDMVGRATLLQDTQLAGAVKHPDNQISDVDMDAISALLVAPDPAPVSLPNAAQYTPKVGDQVWHTVYGECSVDAVSPAGHTVDLTDTGDRRLLCVDASDVTVIVPVEAAIPFEELAT